MGAGGERDGDVGVGAFENDGVVAAGSDAGAGCAGEDQPVDD